ncbi:MAG: helix-turn-helix domain-containing protein [Armatimonadota bacterium]
MNFEDAVMNAQEAAVFLHVPVQTLYEEARRKRVPGEKVGKEWRFSRCALEGYLGQQANLSIRIHQDDIAVIVQGVVQELGTRLGGR